MEPDRDARASGETYANRNVMLYWDEGPPFPEGIIAIAEIWRSRCPGWNVMLFGKEMAYRFLHEKFGDDICKLFLICNVHAMRSDFFRVFWALSEGGIYADMDLIPQREPLFFDPSRNLTVPISYRRFKNSIFYSKKECDEIKLVAFEIIKAVSEKKEPLLNRATAGAWMRALVRKESSEEGYGIALRRMISQGDTGMIKVVNYEILYREFLCDSPNYPGPKPDSDNHWKQLQRRVNIYAGTYEGTVSQ